MTGSLHEAEDLVQETFLRAWKGSADFQGGSSLRTWLYRIATNVCLDALKRRRPPRLLRPKGPASDPRLPVGAPTEDLNWLEPYPDTELPGALEGPEERLVRGESVSLAFCAALQLLPPRQRAILILSDVLDWKSREISALLTLSVPAVESALHRARTTLSRNRPGPAEDSGAGPVDAEVNALLDRYLQAWHARDVDALVALLREDASLSMPPFSSWYQGREPIHAILSQHPFGFGLRAGWQPVPTRANGSPAFILYRADQAGEPFTAFGIMMLCLGASPAGPRVSALTIYKKPDIVSRFGFPMERSFRPT